MDSFPLTLPSAFFPTSYLFVLFCFSLHPPSMSLGLCWSLSALHHKRLLGCSFSQWSELLALFLKKAPLPSSSNELRVMQMTQSKDCLDRLMQLLLIIWSLSSTPVVCNIVFLLLTLKIRVLENFVSNFHRLKYLNIANKSIRQTHNNIYSLNDH